MRSPPVLVLRRCPTLPKQRWKRLRGGQHRGTYLLGGGISVVCNRHTQNRVGRRHRNRGPSGNGLRHSLKDTQDLWGQKNGSSVRPILAVLLGLLPRLPPPTCAHPVSSVGLGPRCYTTSLLWSPGPRPSPVFRSAICDCLSLNVSVPLRSPLYGEKPSSFHSSGMVIQGHLQKRPARRQNPSGPEVLDSSPCLRAKAW